jgi:hypothetical protein
LDFGGSARTVAAVRIIAITTVALRITFLLRTAPAREPGLIMSDLAEYGLWLFVISVAQHVAGWLAGDWL